MKTMKHFLLILVLFSFIILGCKKKFEEGPYFSIKSANKRIKGDWELQVLSINGIDSAPYYNAVFKEKCIFEFDSPENYGDEGAITMLWGKDSNNIRNTRLWYDNARFGAIYSETEKDTLPSYYLFHFCQSWYSEPFDIRYLTDKKLILQIKPNENYIQRLEFKKL